MTSVDALSVKPSKFFPVLNQYKDDSSLLSNSRRLKLAEKRKSSVSISPYKISKKGKTRAINGYKKLKKLGEGTFSKVWLSKHLLTGKTYAIKQMNKSLLRRRKFGITGRTAYDAVKEELKVLQ